MNFFAKIGLTFVALIFLVIPEPFLDAPALALLYFVWVKN